MVKNVKKVAIIVAAGSGSRMRSVLPKQFLPVQGKPLLMHTLFQFHRYDPAITLVLVLPADEEKRWQSYCSEYSFTVQHRVVSGGATRFHSVLNALNTLKEPCLVAVHDGVRPFVSTEVIERCFQQATRTGSAVPVMPPVDSMRQLTHSGSIAVSREAYRLVQTPQVFKSDILKSAYNQIYQDNFTDDASVVEAYGEKVHLVDGNRENIKITTPFDLMLAEAYLSMNQ